MQYIVLISLAFFPYLLHAADLKAVLFSLKTIVDNFIGAAVAVALLVFVWGVVKTMISMNGGGSVFDADGKKGSGVGKAIEEGKQRMVWGIVGLFVIVSIWGIIGLLGQLFGVPLTTSNQPTPVIELP